MLSGPGCLNGRVQGQQIGLLADLLNNAHHLADLLGAVGQRGHLLRNSAGGRGNLLHSHGRGLHHGAALIGCLG